MEDRLSLVPLALLLSTLYVCSLFDVLASPVVQYKRCCALVKEGAEVEAAQNLERCSIEAFDSYGNGQRDRDRSKLARMGR
jgi:hypothetical protein